MSNSFEIAWKKCSFKPLSKEEFSKIIDDADELCSSITQFLPFQIIKPDQRLKSEEDEEETSKSFSPKVTFGSTSRAKSVEELHERLNLLRGKKLSYPERLMKKGLKNRLKKKMKLEERRQFKADSIKQAAKGKKYEEDEIKEESKQEKSETKEIKEDLQFSKLQFPKTNNFEPKKKNSKDSELLLKKLQKKNKQLKKLEIKGEKDKLVKIKTQDQWESAIKKAEGVKMKDNVEILKNTLAKKKHQKNVSKKNWAEREKKLQATKEEAQKKRQENMNKKKKERSKKKVKQLVKKA